MCTNLGNVHLVGFYCIIMLQCAVQKTKNICVDFYMKYNLLEEYELPIMPSLYTMTVNISMSPKMHGMNISMSPSIHGINISMSTNVHCMNISMLPNIHGMNISMSLNVQGMNISMSPNVHGMNIGMSPNIHGMNNKQLL